MTNYLRRDCCGEWNTSRNYVVYQCPVTVETCWRRGKNVHHQTAQFVTWCLPAVPSEPPQLSIASTSPTDIRLMWHPLSSQHSRGAVTRYRIEYSTLDQGEQLPSVMTYNKQNTFLWHIEYTSGVITVFTQAVHMKGYICTVPIPNVVSFA